MLGYNSANKTHRSYSLITFRHTHMEKGKVMMIRNQESTSRAYPKQ